MRRKSFILHTDSLDVVGELSTEQKADLFQAIIDFNLGNEVKLSGLMNAIFIPFKNQFIRDSEKYDNISIKNSENGKKGGRPSKKQETEESEQKRTVFNESEQKQTKAEKAYNDNDSDNVNDSYNDNKNTNDNDNVCVVSDKSENKTKSFKQWMLEDFQNEMTKYKLSYPTEILIQFYDYWRELTPSGKMRLQLEKSWQTDLRIEKWFKNSNNFVTKNQKPNQKQEMHKAFRDATINIFNKL